MGLSTSYSKAESDIQLSKLKQLFGSGLHDKPLKISDPTPTALGGYVLSDVGTYSFGTTEPGKWNVGFLSTSGWEIVDIELNTVNDPESLGAEKLGISIDLTFPNSGYIDGNGTAQNFASTAFTNIIPIPDGYQYALIDSTSTFTLPIYDENDSFIETLGGSPDGTYKIFKFPSLAKGTRYTRTVDDINFAKLVFLKNIDDVELINVNPTYTNGFYIDDLGNEIPSSSYSCSDLIVKPKGVNSAKFAFSSVYTVATYDKNGDFIETIGKTGGDVEYWETEFSEEVEFIRHNRLNSQQSFIQFIKYLYYFPFLKESSVQQPSKNIYAFGTSIPAGYPKQNDQNVWAYPNIVANRLKANIFNLCVPNGVIRSAKSDGTSMGSRDALSFTNLSVANNYQTSIINKIGTSEEPDLITLEYSVNDYDADPTDINNFANFDMTSEDTTTFIGAYNKVIKEVLSVKKSQKFLIITHFSDDSLSPGIASFSNVNKALEKIADYWSIPILRLHKVTQWINRNGVNVLASMNPDGIHPASMTTIESVTILADILENEVRKHL